MRMLLHILAVLMIGLLLTIGGLLCVLTTWAIPFCLYALTPLYALRRRHCVGRHLERGFLPFRTGPPRRGRRARLERRRRFVGVALLVAYFSSLLPSSLIPFAPDPAPAGAQISISKVSGLQAALNALKKTDGEQPGTIKGLYNAKQGLARWFEGQADAGVLRDGTGRGGVDVIFWGDSWPKAYGDSGRSGTSIAVFRNLIQTKNPVMRADGSREGGAGFQPVIAGDSSWDTDDPVDGSLRSDAMASYDGTAGSFQDSHLTFLRWATGAADRRVRWTFDGTGARSIQNRDRVTSVRPILRRFSGDGIVRFDVNTSDAFVAISGGAGTQDCNGGTLQANHWPVPAGWSGLTATNVNCVQMGSPSGGTGPLDIFGVIAYYNDETKGYRVHDLCNPGSRMDLFFNTGTSVLSAYGISVCDYWSSSAPGTGTGDATCAKLFVIDWILNDILADNGTTVTVTTWEAQLRVAVARIKASASRPSILYIIPPAGTNATRLALYPSYIAAIKRVMNDNLDCMAVWDVGEYLGDGVSGAQVGQSYNNLFLLLGISNADGTHLNAFGQEWLGRMLFRILGKVRCTNDAQFQRVRRIADAKRDGTYNRYVMRA